MEENVAVPVVNVRPKAPVMLEEKEADPTPDPVERATVAARAVDPVMVIEPPLAVVAFAPNCVVAAVEAKLLIGVDPPMMPPKATVPVPALRVKLLAPLIVEVLPEKVTLAPPPLEVLIARLLVANVTGPVLR